MFTGLIARKGRIARVSRGRGLVLEIKTDKPWTPALELGESIAVNGVCLTVAACDAQRFTADVLRETEERTGLGEVKPGDAVNLERAVRAGQPLGGHIVQGHVDGRGTVSDRVSRGRDWRMRVRCGRVLAAQIVLKGSIAIDGVSLTVTEVGDDYFAVDLIPTTAQETTLGDKRVGDKVNLETDIVGKYMQKEASTGLTEDKLREAGFLL